GRRPLFRAVPGGPLPGPGHEPVHAHLRRRHLGDGGGAPLTPGPIGRPTLATKTYVLKQEGIDSGWAEGEAESEVELDLGDSEQAVVAAGWVEPVEEKKGGKK